VGPTRGQLATDPGGRLRRHRAAGPHRGARPEVRRGVLRRGGEHRRVRVLRYRRHLPALPRKVRATRRRGGDRRGGPHRRARRPARPPAAVLAAGLLAVEVAAWWRRHWQRSGVVDVEVADQLEDGWRLWLRWEEVRLALDSDAPRGVADMLRADAGRHLGFVRVIARTR